MSLTPTKEQAEILLPLLPTLLSRPQQPAQPQSETKVEVARYSVDEMFVKKKNLWCIPAQNYPLVRKCFS